MSVFKNMKLKELIDILRQFRKHHTIKYYMMRKNEIVDAMDRLFEFKDGLLSLKDKININSKQEDLIRQATIGFVNYLKRVREGELTGDYVINKYNSFHKSVQEYFKNNYPKFYTWLKENYKIKDK
jgi:hypothetical protein